MYFGVLFCLFWFKFVQSNQVTVCTSYNTPENASAFQPSSGSETSNDGNNTQFHVNSHILPMLIGSKGEKGATGPKGDAGTVNMTEVDLINHKLEGK